MGALGIGALSIGQQAQAAHHELPPLPYAVDALEPHIDAKTMEIHHGKHHAAYVNNLTKALAAHKELQDKPLEALLTDLNSVPEDIRTAVRNNGGGHYNHSMFWRMLTPKPTTPSKALQAALDRSFGSRAAFEDQFTKAGASVFGSGWAWLVLENGGKLAIRTTPNQDNPVSSGVKPLLGVDVWEHAYYLKYQNRRPEYLAAFLKVINWDYVSERLG